MNSPTYRFIPAMFRAVMEKRKTQTRRVIVPQPVSEAHWNIHERTQASVDFFLPDTTCVGSATAPYGPPGTVKPVVTAWAVDREWDATAPKIMDPDVVLAEHGIVFNDGVTPKPDWAGKWRPAMFFPKQFYPRAPQARCVSVKVERVSQIDAGSAIAEGVMPLQFKGRHPNGGDWLGFHNYQLETVHPKCGIVLTDEQHRIRAFASPIDSFRSLWDSINADRGGGKYAWAQNPLVFATTFELVEADSADFDDDE